MDQKLGAVTDRSLAKRVERGLQQIELDSGELPNLDVQAVHTRASTSFCFLLHAVDQRSNDAVLVHALLAFEFWCAFFEEGRNALGKVGAICDASQLGELGVQVNVEPVHSSGLVEKILCDAHRRSRGVG